MHSLMTDESTYPVIAESVVQGVSRQDVRVVVNLVQSDHQTRDPSCAHVPSTERLHESEVEWRGPLRRILEGRVHLEHISVIQYFTP